MDTKEELTQYSGKLIWKGSMEYFAEGKWLYGDPYYNITEINKIYYFWALDMTDPESGKYVLLEKNKSLAMLEEKALKLNNIKFEEKKKKDGY